MPSIAGSMLMGLMTSISLTLVLNVAGPRGSKAPRTSGKGEGVSGRIAIPTFHVRP